MTASLHRGPLPQIRQILADGRWYTLYEVADRLDQHYSATTVSAKIRQLRSEGFVIECRRRKGMPPGVMEYSAVVIPEGR